MAGEGPKFCMNCGTELPAEAKFCLSCGAPQTAGVRSAREKWERCEITYTRKQSLVTDSFTFWADAVGPRGSYSAGSVKPFKQFAPYTYPPDRNNDKAKAAHKQLVTMLLSDGWEPVDERGEGWWQLRFRRRVG